MTGAVGDGAGGAPPRRGFVVRLRHACRSDGRWGLLLCLVALASLTLVFVTNKRPHAPESDGFYNWMFARSAVWDRDFNFTNDYAVCGDPWTLRGRQQVKGRPDNPYYIGPSLLWVPLLSVARAVLPAPETAPLPRKMGCGRPYTSFVFFFAGPLLATFTLWLCYRAARRFAADGPAALAAALIGLGGSLAAYAAELPWIGHLQSATASALLVLAVLRAWERPEPWGRWLAVLGAFTLVSIERSTDALLGVLPAVAALVKLRGQWRRLAALGVLFPVAFALGQLPHLLVSKYLSGNWFPSTLGTNFMHFDQPHPFLLLFAPHGGFFYYTPAMWAAAIGAVYCVRDHRALRPLVLACLAAVTLAIYLNASALDWFGSGTYGSRRLVFLTVIMVIFAACLTERVARFLQARPRFALGLAGLGLAAPFITSNLVAVTAQGNVHVRIDSASPQADLYGSAPKLVWSWVDDSVGPLAVLPAALVFSLRYGLPPTSFHQATTATYYKRNHMTLGWITRHVPMNVPKLVRGATMEANRMTVTDRRATLVFAAMWPYATHIQITARAAKPTQLRVGRGGWFGTRWYGPAVKVDTTDRLIEIPIPKGGFGSGLMEVVFEADNPGLVISSIGFDDKAPRPKPWASNPPLPGIVVARR